MIMINQPVNDLQIINLATHIQQDFGSYYNPAIIYAGYKYSRRMVVVPMDVPLLFCHVQYAPINKWHIYCPSMPFNWLAFSWCRASMLSQQNQRMAIIYWIFSGSCGVYELYFDGLVQNCSNSIANALELLPVTAVLH